MSGKFFFILKKTRKEESGWNVFTGSYLEDEIDSEYYVAWFEKPFEAGFVLASRDTLADLKDFLSKNYGEFGYIIIDNKELKIDG